MGDDRSSDEKTLPAHRLVAHDIRLQRAPDGAGRREVEATVECELESCTKTVEQCAACLRFARVEVHEAGYVLLCRSRSTCEPGVDSTDEPTPRE